MHEDLVANENTTSARLQAHTEMHQELVTSLTSKINGLESQLKLKNDELITVNHANQVTQVAGE